jgi:hypothetical protein
VRLIIDGKHWSFHNPPGSLAGMPQCQLHLMYQPEEIKVGECEIVKEEG